MIKAKKIKSPKTVDFLSTEFYQMIRSTCEKNVGDNITRFMFLSPDQTSKIIATELFVDNMNCPVKSIYPGNIKGRFIGETEKNLSDILSSAEHHDLILYFEEGDMLFQKREENDEEKLSNSEIFKKLDEHDCLTIFEIKKLKTAEKIKTHFDFIVRFPYLSTQVRKMFWKLKQMESLQSGENGDLKPAAEI